MPPTRRASALVVVLATAAAAGASATSSNPPRPNVVLMMADDLGWGDLGCYGGADLVTPHLDAMATEGVLFERFYAAAPVCSPTRGSFLTGRHPHRYGITGANSGHLPADEPNLAAALRARGYATGFFGKWHLGTLTRDDVDSNRGGRPAHDAHYAPPWERGFDVVFATEAKVPTHDPMRDPKTGAPYGTAYWTGPAERVTENLDGDDSRIIVDRALPFLEAAVADERPFLAVLWFHAPHLPTVSSADDRAVYGDLPEAARDYAGCVTALDREVGRLRATLAGLGVADETIVFFCSDNGPEGKERAPGRFGSTGGLSGRKRSLREGGVRVPGLLVWPGALPTPRRVTVPASTSDLLPTVLDALDATDDHPDLPRDGVSLLPWLRGADSPRPPLGFVHARQRAWIDGRWKLQSEDGGETFSLFDLAEDPAETTDLTGDHPDRAARMQSSFQAWLDDVRTDPHADRH